MKKLDWYIIKKFLGTFLLSIVLIMSIAVVFDLTEKLDNFYENQVPFREIVFDYYLNFLPYFTDMFSQLFIFISVIFFTSSELRTVLAAVSAHGTAADIDHVWHGRLGHTAIYEEDAGVHR